MEKVSEDGKFDDSETVEFLDVQAGLPNFQRGDVLFAKITPCMENGKGAFLDSLATRYGFGSTEFHVLRPRPGLDPKFLYYFTFNPAYRRFASENMVGAAGQKRVSSRFLLDTRIFLPPLPEQRRIAAFLDDRCAAVDAAVKAKREQIGVLENLKTELALQLVTQGLSASVAMKSTGVDWLPQVPAHWSVEHLKRHCEILRGKFTHRPRNDPALYDGPYPFVQTGDITATPKFITTYSQTLNELGLEASRMFPKGTLVMAIAANIGDVAILDFDACFPDSMVGLIPDRKTDLNFLFYLLRAMKPILLRSAVLSTQLNLNYVRIGNNHAPFPPLEEQKLIARAIEAKEKSVDAIIQTIQSQIETLTTYRKALIHECVTGKRRVPVTPGAPG